MRKTLPVIVVTFITYLLLAYLLVGHWYYAPLLTNFAVLHAALFVHLCLKVTASVAAKPHMPKPDFDYSALRVDVVVPIYNEDPALLAAGLRALAAQDRLPDHVWLIDDGSHDHGEPLLVLESTAVREAVWAAEASGITMHCLRQPNQGKRWAQKVAFRESDADVFVTIDSDTCLDRRAIGKLLIPFGQADVQSVAGMACGQNYRKSILTRAIDLGFTMAFIQGRLAEGFFGQVRVNCGILAAYRGDVVRDNLPRYLNQQFLEQPVKAGDDRALTYFAKERGRTECQIEAIAYSAIPETFGHLVRQRMRWARSWCWGTLLLLRRPITTSDFWFTFTQLVGIFGFATVLVLAITGLSLGVVSGSLLINALILTFVIGAVMHLRYVVVAHPDEPMHQRVFTWLFSPLATLLYIGMTLPLYFVAMLSPRPQKTWGTRETIEVRLHDVSEPVSDKAAAA